MSNKNIVIIGGGTGTATLLSGLRKFPSNNSVIVSSADDGGSTGQLRKELGVFPPGDIRQCLIGLSYAQEEMRHLFGYRFEAGPLKGHNVGNIIIAALEKVTGSAEKAIGQAGRMLNIRGQVLPVSLKPTILTAILDNGKKIVGEHYIDDQKFSGDVSPIKVLKLSPVQVNPKVIKALMEADAIVFGPGDLYTSILPNLLVKGVKEAIIKSTAKKILVTNIMTRYGQTDGFKASNFVRVLESYLGSKINTTIVNNKKPSTTWLKKYKKQKAEFVEPDLKAIEKMGIKVITANLLSTNIYQKSSSDTLQRSFLRHNSDKIAKLIWGISTKYQKNHLQF